MGEVIVRYRIKPGRGEENLRLIQAVFAELDLGQPTGFRYASFVTDDGLGFFHVASVADGARNPLPGTEAFKAFQGGLRDRCELVPELAELREIAAYRFWK